LVVGADREARDLGINLIKKVGIGAFDAGMIQNAVVVETMTAALIAINIRYKVKGAVIRAFDPCLSCATHAVGSMPLEVQLVNP
jgi:coenzyme F420-reducing hydrogenase alpha subunit